MLLGAISPLFHNILLPVVRIGTKFLLRDKQLFEISEVEIMRVYCMLVINVEPLCLMPVFKVQLIAHLTVDMGFMSHITSVYINHEIISSPPIPLSLIQ